MKFAIVTVTYNDGKNLAQTMASVKCQTYQDVMHVVVDGGSIDKTRDIFAQFSDGRDQFHEIVDSGVYDAMNQAIDILEDVDFDYCVFLNAKDTFFQDATLEKICQSLKHVDTQPDILVGPYDFVTGNKREVRNYPAAPGKIKQLLKENRLSECISSMPGHQATYYSKGFIKDKRYDLRFKIAADHNLFVNGLMSGAKIHNLLFPLCRYYSGGLSAQNLNRLQGEWLSIYADASFSEREGLREFNRRDRLLPGADMMLTDNAQLLGAAFPIEGPYADGPGRGQWLTQSQLIALSTHTCLLYTSPSPRD